jgi:hypothetical protein
MDTTSLENALNQDDSEATYRALRDSILQIYQFGTKIAKDSNPDNELQVSWELGDTSLMNWISDTHCYLSRNGQKLQFLARPSKLEIISFSLDEGDKLLICSDSLRQNLSDNEIDEILRESNGSENACQNLLKIASVNTTITDNEHNIVVMEVINHQKVITPTPITESKAIVSKSSKTNPLWFILPLFLMLLGGGAAWLIRNNKFDYKNLLSFNKSNQAFEDTLKDEFLKKSTNELELAKANDTITKEFAEEEKEAVSKEFKDDFEKTEKKETKVETANFDNEKNQKANSPQSTSTNSKSTNKRSSKRDVETENTNNRASNSGNDLGKEEENYNALLQQKEKWVVIKNDLQGLQSSGNTAASEKLRNSEKVLERIEQKLKESGKRLGKN